MSERDQLCADSDSGVQFAEEVVEPRAWTIKGVGQYGSDVEVVSLLSYQELAAQAESFKSQTLRWARGSLARKDAIEKAYRALSNISRSGKGIDDGKWAREALDVLREAAGKELPDEPA